MNGVTIPGVSAGSNHVGASEMWTPQVTWPSGAAAAGTAAAAEISRTRTVTERRGLIMSLQPGGSMGPPYYERPTAETDRGASANSRSAPRDRPDHSGVVAVLVARLHRALHEAPRCRRLLQRHPPRTRPSRAHTTYAPPSP